MGQLTIISVKGFIPHSACRFDYQDAKFAAAWLGFAPARHRASGWPQATPGKVCTDDETARINHGVTFTVPDSRLILAAQAVALLYRDKKYKLGVCDCVSFSAEVARYGALNVPLVNMTPFGLIQVLGVWNVYDKKW